MVTRSEIVSEARTYLNTPWRHQGRTRGQGVDCAGLVVLIANKYNLADDHAYNNIDYPRRPNGTFVGYFRKYATAKSPALARDGDILVFSEGRHPCHVGIRTTFRGQPGVIHAHATARKVVEQTLESAVSTVGHPVYCFEFKGIDV